MEKQLVEKKYKLNSTKFLGIGGGIAEKITVTTTTEKCITNLSKKPQLQLKQTVERIGISNSLTTNQVAI